MLNIDFKMAADNQLMNGIESVVDMFNQEKVILTFLL